MKKLFIRLLSLLSAKERWLLALLILMMIAGALMELAGLGLVMPVIAVLSEPALLEQNKYLKMVYVAVHPASNEQFLLLLCLLVAALYLFKNGFLAFSTWAQSKFIYGRTARMAASLFDNYLRAPYPFHLAKNSSAILNNINMMGFIAGTLFMPAMLLVTEAIVVAAIFGMLLFFAPLTTLGLSIASLAVMLAFYYPFKSHNFALGQRMTEHNREVFQDIMQSFEGIKECKVRNCEDFLSRRHAMHQTLLRNAEMTRFFMGQIPRFSIEAFVIAAGMATLAAFVASGVATGSIVLKLSLVAVAMIRLMPSFSRIQYQLASIRQALPAFNTIFDDLTNLRQPPRPNPQTNPIGLRKSILIDNVSFAYGKSAQVISSVSFEIPRNSSVALVGPTGCGKTTLLDIILGLLKPDSGRVLVDGCDIEENLPSWQTKIGYVPQTIFLMDANIRSNVAFGSPPESIDDAQVRKCLATAQVLDFVDSLPAGLETVVGERGVRLSGGQRQRIGIARALYHNPEILALDEATSALDNDTEKAFVDALKNLKGKLTIIMIAHRLTTVENCNQTIRLDISHPSCLTSLSPKQSPEA